MEARRQAAAEADRFETERHSNRRLRRLLAGVAVALTLALVAGAVAFQQRGVANDRAFDSEIDRMTRDAALLADQDPGLAFLVAAAAHAARPDSETLGGLQQALSRTDGLLGFLGVGTDYSAVVAVDDHQFIARTATGVELWDLGTRTLVNEVAVAGSGEMELIPQTAHWPRPEQRHDRHSAGI